MDIRRLWLVAVLSNAFLGSLALFPGRGSAATGSPLDVGLAGAPAMSSAGAATSSFILDLLRAKSAGSLSAAAGDTALFSGGSYWSLEAVFEGQRGVSDVISGYAGHAETVEIVFDPRVVTYEVLLAVFWHNIDPTQVSGQLCDLGSQYRAAIRVRSDAQREAALASRKRIAASGVMRAPIVTEIVEAGAFYRAEAEQQDFYRKQRARYRAYRAGCDRDRRLAAIWQGRSATVSTAQTHE